MRETLLIGPWLRIERWVDGAPPGFENLDQYVYSLNDDIGSSLLELDKDGQIISNEEYYPFGGTSFWTSRTQVEADQKTRRYGGKERDATGLCDYGYRYYAPWLARWVSPDPSGTVDGLNLYCMVGNNPVTWRDPDGREKTRPYAGLANAFARGDVIYGLAKPRGKALKALKAAGHKRHVTGAAGRIQRLLFGQPKTHVTIQNDLTNSVWRLEDPSAYASDFKIRKRITDPGRGIRFKRFLAGHPRYNVASTSQSKRGLLTFPEMKNLWRKTSKAGLEFQVTSNYGAVHFVVEKIIDSIDVVISKRGWGKSITSSELRWLYRHKDTEAVRNRVRFWNQDGELPHEQVFDAVKWQAYAPTNRYDSAWGAQRA